MFKYVIDKSLGEPWPRHGLTSTTWLNQPIRAFLITDLTATQNGIYLHALIWPHPPVGGDPYPHVIVHGGCNYLEDGHTRVFRAMLKQQPMIFCRWHAPQPQE